MEQLALFTKPNTRTIVDTLHFANYRVARFSKHLTTTNVDELNYMTCMGWLTRVDKPFGRYAWQISDEGKHLHEFIEKIRYQAQCNGDDAMAVIERLLSQ